MKNLIHLYPAILLLFGFTLNGQDISPGETTPGTTEISIACSNELMPLMETWADHYTGLNPNVRIHSTILTADELSEDRLKTNDLLFISETALTSTRFDHDWKMVVGREIIVPVMNSESPFAEKIGTTGLAPEKIANAIQHPSTAYWSHILEIKDDHPLRILIPEDASVVAAMESYLTTDHISAVERIPAKDEFIRTIQNDPFAIGFCKLTDVTNKEVLELMDHIMLVPIDKNGNGELDYFENIYSSVNDFTRGVWIGKYPGELTHNVYAIATEQPAEAGEIAFLKWVLTSGQLQLASEGYSDLTFTERQSWLSRINEGISLPPAPASSNTGLKSAIIAILVLIILGIFVEGFIILRKFRKPSATAPTTPFEGVFTEASMHIPGGLYYDKTHTWAFMESGGKVKVGINDFLPHLTGRVTGIKMKKAGEKVKKGEVILTLVKDGKQLNIKAPVSGTIMQTNKNLPSHASLINASPYTDGWVYMLEPTNWLREIQLLLMADKFKTWIGGEFKRVKDFLAGLQESGEPRLAEVVLQEGGEIIDGVLADLGPEEWEDFQTKFMEKTL